MGALGLGMSFLPQELLGALGAPGASGAMVVIAQVIGALYLGFAMLNWMARGNPIGGIYSRPIAMGNFLHFTVAAIALAKALLAGASGPARIGLTAMYVILAVWFGAVLFTSPVRGET
jgi:hypothetical protein